MPKEGLHHLVGQRVRERWGLKGSVLTRWCEVTDPDQGISDLALLDALAEELCFEMPLEPGDIQLLNNHVIYHGRTAFTDDAGSSQDRLLYRLWLSMPNSRPLPESHRVLWGSVEAGALRGGFGISPG